MQCRNALVLELQDRRHHLQRLRPEDRKFRKVFGELEGDKLSRMPQGFPTEAAHGEILKYKSFVVSSVKTEAFFCADDWIDRTVEDFKLLQPFNHFLNYTIGEFFGKA